MPLREYRQEAPVRDPETGQWKSLYTTKQLEEGVAPWRKMTGMSGILPCVNALISNQKALTKWVNTHPAKEWPLFPGSRLNSDLRAQYRWELALSGYPGFIAYLNSGDPRWIRTGKIKASKGLKNMINIYLEMARLGALEANEDKGRNELREQVLKMAEEEGIYGYFKNDESELARWIQTSAKTREELKRDPEYIAAKAREETRESEQLKYGINAVYANESVEISCPSLTDIFRFGALSKYFGEDEVERRKQMYRHFLSSPIPKKFLKLQRIAKETDDIEDYISTGIGATWVGAKVAARYAPGLAKLVGERAIPVLGWAMLITDLLNFATGLFSLGSNPMGVKRVIEGAKALGFKNARGRVKNAERIKNWKPSVGTILEALQASEDATGYGLRLGPLMGCISEMFWGTTKLISGDVDKVKVSMPWDRPGTMEYKAYKALGAAGELLPMLYHTKPELYVATVATIAIALEAGAKKSFHPQWDKVYLQIKDMELVETPPDNPYTRQALKELGFDPDEKVGYLGIDGPYMPKVSQLGDFYDRPPGKDLETKVLELKDSWTAYAWNCALYDLDTISLDALAYPDGGVEYHHWSDLDMLVITAKLGVVPPRNTPPEAIKAYCDQISMFLQINDKWPTRNDLQKWATAIFGIYDTTCPPTHTYRR